MNSARIINGQNISLEKQILFTDSCHCVAFKLAAYEQYICYVVLGVLFVIILVAAINYKKIFQLLKAEGIKQE